MTSTMFATPRNVSEFLGSSAVRLPLSGAIKRRNVLVDQLFYDVGALSKAEIDALVDETNLEGSILVVSPRNSRAVSPIRKVDDYEELCAERGSRLTRFSIAGVGSSDVGAAAFARNLADHYGEPVGAIVAGYGVADVIAEGLGGWFVLGAGNSLMRFFHDREAETAAVREGLQRTVAGFDPTNADEIAATLTGSPDSTTLLRLLLDEDREIKTVLGHSKGCLSIAWAIQALVLSGAEAAIEKAKATRLITTGAAVDLPHGFENIGQYLGALDLFGAMNSRGAGSLYDIYSSEQIHLVPNASHHTNTELPFHMSIADVLEQDDAITS